MHNMNCATPVCVFKGDDLRVFDHQVSWLIKNFNIGIFSDTRNVINVKLCMMVLHIELYMCSTLSVILTSFQGHVFLLD